MIYIQSWLSSRYNVFRIQISLLQRSEIKLNAGYYVSMNNLDPDNNHGANIAWIKF